MSNDDEAGRVGYGRPPMEHRFKKGRSGNPKGRPKHSPDGIQQSELNGLILKEARRPVRILENGRPRKLTTQQAVVRRLFMSGMTGDIRAARIAMELVRAAGKDAKVEHVSPANTSEDWPQATTGAEALAIYLEMINGKPRQ